MVQVDLYYKAQYEFVFFLFIHTFIAFMYVYEPVFNCISNFTFHVFAHQCLPPVLNVFSLEEVVIV